MTEGLKWLKICRLQRVHTAFSLARFAPHGLWVPHTEEDFKENKQAPLPDTHTHTHAQAAVSRTLISVLSSVLIRHGGFQRGRKPSLVEPQRIWRPLGNHDNIWLEIWRSSHMASTSDQKLLTLHGKITGQTLELFCSFHDMKYDFSISKCQMFPVGSQV